MSYMYLKGPGDNQPIPDNYDLGKSYLLLTIIILAICLILIIFSRNGINSKLISNLSISGIITGLIAYGMLRKSVKTKGNKKNEN